jgi:hypothetical protein
MPRNGNTWTKHPKVPLSTYMGYLPKEPVPVGRRNATFELLAAIEDGYLAGNPLTKYEALSYRMAFDGDFRSGFQAKSAV